MNLLPALLFGGPPHAGKSVLFYNLAKALRERGIPHHAIRACPDGEGNWFHELDQDKVRLIRVKGGWTSDFVKRICLDIERRHLPLLVDIGGRPTQRETCLFRNCTHSLLLLRADQEDSADLWRHLVRVNGLLPLAELYSARGGMSVGATAVDHRKQTTRMTWPVALSEATRRCPVADRATSGRRRPGPWGDRSSRFRLAVGRSAAISR